MRFKIISSATVRTYRRDESLPRPCAYSRVRVIRRSWRPARETREVNVLLYHPTTRLAILRKTGPGAVAATECGAVV